MDRINEIISGVIKPITDLGLGLVTISLIAEILFGPGALFGADVIGNVTAIVSQIGGENGLIGLVALFVLLTLIQRR